MAYEVKKVLTVDDLIKLLVSVNIKMETIETMQKEIIIKIDKLSKQEKEEKTETPIDGILQNLLSNIDLSNIDLKNIDLSKFGIGAKKNA